MEGVASLQADVFQLNDSCILQPQQHIHVKQRSSLRLWIVEQFSFDTAATSAEEVKTKNIATQPDISWLQKASE